ncbi:hypothetical protein DTO166G4_1323 [Paecilomyces variotii]|nr:hypothetical protein DTO166G4_1323 [Paecilomyces variotii]KAJ9242322.1 hypothetical protein DTO166G5_725 [Paecilomyces variotii]KAJ9258050.1 hypothetical protein DTO207G8_1827 [Paecilomyces variotii]KAJ9262323.1 hypothetical protein DTO195F2_3710 [Paecilomyces variotii]KAJ9353172.1 hypothetical protein DTO027B9_5424 [Paecilomyces variotii]
MASHQIAIAKASFSAGLLRPDPTSVPRDEITGFHSALDKALSHCFPANIQTCKAWLLRNVVQSSNRVGVLGKYLVVLSESFKPTDEKPRGPPPQGRRETSGKRKRLHILYLLNDLFHHTKYHSENNVAFSTVTGALQPYIIDLIGQAAAFDREKNPKHHRRLDELLDIWKANGYYSSDYVDKLREAVRNSASVDAIKASVGISDANADVAKTATSKDVPFVMPATHGDASTPYYDLPAGNLVPHIIPDSTAPIRPDAVKPLQFLAGPADQKLVTALKKFLKDVDRIYENDEPEHDENTVIDIDEMGQTVIRDETTGEVIGGETYYGWSLAVAAAVGVGVRAGVLENVDVTVAVLAAMADAAHAPDRRAVLLIDVVPDGATPILVHGALQDAAPVLHPGRSLTLLDWHRLRDPLSHNHITHIPHHKEFPSLHLQASSHSPLRILSLCLDRVDILFLRPRPRTIRVHGHLHLRLHRQEERFHHRFLGASILAQECLSRDFLFNRKGANISHRLLGSTPDPMHHGAISNQVAEDILLKAVVDGDKD